MSYDFMIFRSLRELRSLEDIDSPSALIPGDWRADVQELLSHVIPGLAWSTSGDGCSAAHPDSAQGRFELFAQYSAGITVLHVNGSHHADQMRLVQQCAVAVGGYAFDMQTCARVWPEEGRV